MCISLVSLGSEAVEDDSVENVWACYPTAIPATLTLTSFFIKWWLVPGILMSVLWGLRAATIFKTPIHPRWQRFYQFTSNFVGSFTGWCCLYALAVRANATPDLRSLNGMDALLFLVALLSLTGHLVQALAGLMDGVQTLAHAIVKNLGG